MTPQQFRLLVVVNQIFLFGGYVISEVTAPTLPPELQSYFTTMDSSVMESGLSGSSAQVLYMLWIALDIANLIAAVGLCLGRRWGRTLFLACFIISVLGGLLSPPSLSSNWASMIFGLFTTTEGMIIALAYFSHLRRMFNRAEEADRTA